MGDAGGFLNLGHVVVLGGALGGEAQHGHAGLDAGQRAGRFRRADGDVGQRFRVGIDVHGAVGEDHHAVVAVGLVRALHQEAGGHGLDAGLGLDDLQRRAQHVGGGMDRAGDQSVRVAGLDHQDAVVHGILDHFGGLLGGHALGLAQLVEDVGVFRALVGGRGIDDLDAVQRRAVGGLTNLLGVAQQGQFGEAFLRDDRGGLRVAGLFTLGKNDVLDVGLGLCLNLINDCHDDPSVYSAKSGGIYSS